MSQTPPPPGPDEPSGTDPVPPSAAQPPYGQAPPPYGQAPPPYVQAQPTYGQPPSPYGQPSYGYNIQAAPSKTLAIWALVLACIPCLITNLVSFVLALVVLIGRKGGKGLAIAALIINVLVLVGWAALVALGVILSGTPVDDLESGQCFTAEGIGGADDEGIYQIEVVGCDEAHDGEVLATQELDADAAQAYPAQSAEDACAPLLDPAVLAGLPADVTITALTQDDEPDAGDHLACVAHHVDGEELTEKIG